jgi:hypothetical protein
MASPEPRAYAVTREHRGRFFGAGEPMSAEPEHRQQEDEDSLESTELARRLRRMEWPPAPAEVKARVLERVVERSKEALDGGPPDASND